MAHTSHLSLRPALLAAHLVLLSACEVPEAPKWDITLALPLTADTLSIVDFLPPEISDTVIEGQRAFTLEPIEEAVEYSLSSLCGETCGMLDQQEVPIPGFSFVDSVDLRFPVRVSSIEPISAALEFSFQNALNFDPLRPHPNPDSAGSLTVIAQAIEGGVRLDSSVVSGTSETFPPGSSRQVVLNLPQDEIGEGIRAFLRLSSPADGQIATIDTSIVLGFNVTLKDATLSAVTVVVEDDTLRENASFTIDEELRREVEDRVKGGVFELELAHPFALSGLLDISLAGSPGVLFSGLPADELRLLSFEVSDALDGRVGRRELSAEEIVFLVDLPELHIGYRVIATGQREDARGRAVNRFTTDAFVTAQVVIEATMALVR